jgi:hypothetical protein
MAGVQVVSGMGWRRVQEVSDGMARGLGGPAGVAGTVREARQLRRRDGAESRSTQGYPVCLVVHHPLCDLVFCFSCVMPFRDLSFVMFSAFPIRFQVLVPFAFCQPVSPACSIFVAFVCFTSVVLCFRFFFPFAGCVVAAFLRPRFHFFPHSPWCDTTVPGGARNRRNRGGGVRGFQEMLPGVRYRQPLRPEGGAGGSHQRYARKQQIPLEDGGWMIVRGTKSESAGVVQETALHSSELMLSG